MTECYFQPIESQELTSHGSIRKISMVSYTMHQSIEIFCQIDDLQYFKFTFDCFILRREYSIFKFAQDHFTTTLPIWEFTKFVNLRP